MVSVRGTDGQEIFKVESQKQSQPIWALAWAPFVDGVGTIAVSDWNQKLVFYDISGKQIGSERSLGYDPCCISYFKNNQYLLIGGSDTKLYLYTNDGIKVGQVTQSAGWIWTCGVNNSGNHVAIGGDDGTITVKKIVFQDVHAHYNDRFAFRQNMTDVIIHHLPSGQKSKIKCRDPILKISVYNDRLGVKLADRTAIFELFHDDTGDMHYRILEKIAKNISGELFQVTSNNVVTCSDKTIHLYNYFGEIEREWILDSPVKLLKIIGGPRGKEGLLIGLTDGSILKIFIDNPFHIPLIKLLIPIVSLDINLNRNKLAIIDESNLLSVFDLKTQTLLYQEPNAESLAWNTEIEDILCFVGKGCLNVKVSDFPPIQVKLLGDIINARGSRVYSLIGTELKETNISLLSTMEKYINQNDYNKAYEIGSLGIAKSEWKKLGIEALEHLNLQVAMKCFVRIQEFAYLEGIRHLESYGKKEADLFMAEIYTLSGNYNEVIF
jgi:intraflagellar transport protein 122